MRVELFAILVALFLAVSSVHAGQPGGPGGPGGPQLPDGVTAQRDLPYAGDNDGDHKLDLYLPAKAEKPLPLLIYIHGGAWSMGDKGVAVQRNAVQLATQGYAVASINYRFSQKAIFPAADSRLQSGRALAARQCREVQP